MRKWVYRDLRRNITGENPPPDWPVWAQVLWVIFLLAICGRIAWVVWMV